MNQYYPHTLFETEEQRAEREKYEAERKAFFESIPKRAEQTLIVGQSSESLVEELRRQLSELGVLRALDQQRIAALESKFAQARAECEMLRDAARAVCQAQNFTEAQQAVRALNTVLLDAARKEGA